MTEPTEHEPSPRAARWEIRRAGRIHSLNRAADTTFDHARPGHGGLDGDAIEWTERLLEVTRYEVSRADEKANTLFRFYGVVAALSVGLLVGQGWSPSDLTTSATVCFWIGVTCFLVSGLMLGMLLYPAKRGRPNGARPLYFGHCPRF